MKLPKMLPFTPEPMAVISLKRTVGSFGIVIGPSVNASKSKSLQLQIIS